MIKVHCKSVGVERVWSTSRTVVRENPFFLKHWDAIEHTLFSQHHFADVEKGEGEVIEHRDE